MTAVKNINYYRTNTYRGGRDDSSVGFIARAIGADDYSLFSVIKRFKELESVNTPTVVEIGGIETDYANRKKSVDRLFKYLKTLSAKNRLLKFTVRIGNMLYAL